MASLPAVASAPSSKRTGYARISGERIGYRGILAVAMLNQGYTWDKIVDVCKISRCTLGALAKRNPYSPELTDLVRKTYDQGLLLTGADALGELGKNLLNPPRASVLWKIAKEAKESYDLGQGPKAQDIGDLLLDMGFKIAASISRLHEQSAQAPAPACLDIEANTDESST